MSYTPGPWEYDDALADDGNKYTPIYSEAPGADCELAEAVCIIPHDDISEEGYKEVKANARLIAAAPDSHESNIELLDAIYSLILRRPIRDLDERIARAETAIAKVKGDV